MYFRKGKVEWNVVNDIDNDIVNLYITILERFDEFAKNVYWIPRGREMYTRFKAEIMAGKVIDIPDPIRAAHYYFLIRNSFNKNPYGVFAKTPKPEWRHEAGGKFMVSYDNRDEIREMYKDYNVNDIQTKYAGAKSARSKIFTELVIMNYEPPSVQETLWKGGEDG